MTQEQTDKALLATLANVPNNVIAAIFHAQVRPDSPRAAFVRAAIENEIDHRAAGAIYSSR